MSGMASRMAADRCPAARGISRLGAHLAMTLAGAQGFSLPHGPQSVEAAKGHLGRASAALANPHHCNGSPANASGGQVLR